MHELWAISFSLKRIKNNVRAQKEVHINRVRKKLKTKIPQNVFFLILCLIQVAAPSFIGI